MWYNENWYSEISKTDVIENTWKDIKWKAEKTIQNMAVDYLNQENIRKLPPHEFNALVDRIKTYLHHVDHDKSMVERKFKELRQSVINESKTNIVSLRELYQKTEITRMTDISSPGDFSRYVDYRLDNWLKNMEDWIWWPTNMSKILLLTSMATASELGKWFADVFKFWEEINCAYDDFKRWSLSAWEKMVTIIKTAWIEWFRALVACPEMKFAKKVLWKLWKFLEEISPSSFNMFTRPLVSEVNYSLSRSSKIVRTKERNISKSSKIDEHWWWHKWSREKWKWQNEIKEVAMTESEKVYSAHPELKAHKEFLWELRNADILWEWQNAIIVRHPTNDKLVVKVAKEWKVDSLELEIQNHQKFYDALKDWRNEFPGQLWEEIKIPSVNRWIKDSKWIFVMEKIEWQNLATKFYREKYKQELEKFWEKYLNGLTDSEFDNLMTKEKLRKVPTFLIDWDFSGKMLGKEMKEFFNNHTHGTELWNVLDFLEWKWLRHNDLHPWNIMIDNKGNTYIIDFWRVIVK